MCGIVGYIGKRQAASVILSGLKSLEYRGYDSSGIATYHQGHIEIHRRAGKLSALTDVLHAKLPEGHLGIGHTRWATHGRPTDQNAHPHESDGVVMVHNGIIENYLQLKEALIKKGHVFKSETDTEVLCHLVSEELKIRGDLVAAVRAALLQAHGAYAVVVMAKQDPSQIVAARLTSPLVIGIGQGEQIIASDIPAILPYTRQIVTLDEGELAVLSTDSVKISTIEGTPKPLRVRHIDWSPAMAERGGYKHFMLKEIFEQPQAIADTLRGRIDLQNQRVVLEQELQWQQMPEQIIVLAMGTSYNAGLYLRYEIEHLAKIPCQIELASEFRYRCPVIRPHTCVIAISQSGETADTIAGVKEAKALGAHVLAICNVMDSSLTRLADATLYTRAGIEIGVASTKAYMTQLAAAKLLALFLAQKKEKLSTDQIKTTLDAMMHLPVLVQSVLHREEEIMAMAKSVVHTQSMLFLGRGREVGTAYEGALKLKELSYIHAEGYAAGEMKHGPIALIDEQFFVMMVAPHDANYEKIVSNAQEVKARGGHLLSIVSQGDTQMHDLSDKSFEIPKVDPSLYPFLTVIPLQLLSYHVACLRGHDVDQPRNLAKSVTVE